jgi:hypothetical protein
MINMMVNINFGDQSVLKVFPWFNIHTVYRIEQYLGLSPS